MSARRSSFGVGLLLVLSVTTMATGRASPVEAASYSRSQLECSRPGIHTLAVGSHRCVGYEQRARLLPDGRTELTIVVSGGVIDGETAEAQRALARREDLEPYLSATGEHAPDEAVVALAHRLVTGVVGDARRSERILTWVSRQVVHADDPGHPETPAATLATRRGSCVGRSRLAVALLRAVGIPARSIHGLLLPDQLPGGAMVGSATFALHRWVETHVEGLGWVPSDPGESIHVVDARHVFLALDEEAYDLESQRDLALRIVTPAAPLAGWLRPEGRSSLVVRRIAAVLPREDATGGSVE